MATVRRRPIHDETEQTHPGAELGEGDSLLHKLKVIGVCTSAGVVFGIAMEKGRVFEPEVIRSQMVFEKYIMLKMFLSAVSSGMFSMSVLSMLPVTQRKFQKAQIEYVACLNNKGLLTVTLGAGLLGVGMTLSGACPGMVLVQVGALAENAIYTFSGALLGAALYGFVEPAVVRLTKPSKPMTVLSLDGATHSPYFVLALPMAAMLGMAVAGLELWKPWQTELAVDSAVGTSWLSARAWPPALAGAIIGLLQVPILLAVSDTLGGSSSYCTIVSQLLVNRPLENLSSYLRKFKKGMGNWWQVFYVSGAVLGGYLSASASGSLGTARGVAPLSALTGGALMLFGARLAGGCTSGHGLSGVGLLNLLSFAAVPAMFGGGILAALVLKNLGTL
ncbi:uncharacterized protein LOC106173630 [Lingula anatina]|uniref:Uncharacterized protein LOC106173630 n=1 Tax=Lingula anatina TaxID=7574 RepID=A0A1S3JIR9_LINAN|nr:uncharacterized protein LOC106173630 [Lingula anatina]XP_023932882.1 uncharacterized protein LOC106173630 [Lingula anatina]XP_023932883.1 uncharacterized protein LOC106173630 [Lingula anatina]XP_023932884.1 uncharacterized protein LOC106173630 [Lingula anatina]XP_023932885.1 uncharacterized protein LOC106173630 [Lingula anatina]XP_023932886.1 uncharacterized protein LOC106173630 [Lingula anatina]XP_023932887.1 uncharacterized protein LOC106173630 [Lingula anatina]XP_023932888.1 uncharacte|eukprot:XP_013410268.1 uncharacterized protein LOC106173630 [Lingula anatina]